MQFRTKIKGDFCDEAWSRPPGKELLMSKTSKEKELDAKLALALSKDKSHTKELSEN